MIRRWFFILTAFLLCGLMSACGKGPDLDGLSSPAAAVKMSGFGKEVNITDPAVIEEIKDILRGLSFSRISKKDAEAPGAQSLTLRFEMQSGQVMITLPCLIEGQRAYQADPPGVELFEKFFDMPVSSSSAPANTEESRGLAYMSESMQALVMAVGDDYNTLVNYMPLKAGQHLKDCFAGARISEDSLVLKICLSDSGDQECLAELAAIGLVTEYQVEQGIGTKAYLSECLSEISQKLDEIRRRVDDHTATDEETELIERYKPKPDMNWFHGTIDVEVNIRTPWAVVPGENWTQEDTMRDLEHCKELFAKLVGEYEILMFGYAV